MSVSQQPKKQVAVPATGFEILWETAFHSWFGRRCHIIRQNGTVVRAIVCQIVFGHHHWGFRCSYFSQGGRKTKTVSPLALLWTQLMWQDAAILSDEEEQSAQEVEAAAQCVPDLEEFYQNRVLPDVPNQAISLPNTQLVVDTSRFPPQHRALLKSINWKIREVTLFQRVCARGT